MNRTAKRQQQVKQQMKQDVFVRACGQKSGKVNGWRGARKRPPGS